MRPAPSALPRVAAPAARVANLVLAGYLALTLPVALVATTSRAAAMAAVALGHAAMLLFAWRSVRRTPAEAGWLRELRDWLPLLALPLLYAELPVLIGAVGTPFQDPRVIGWESALFGNPARSLAARWPSRALSELLHLGYLSYYPLIYAPALLLRLRRRWADFDTTVLAATLAFTACFAVFVVFPVQGPRYLWPAPAGIPEGPVRELTLWLLGAGSSRGAAFPSSHAAVAVAHVVVALWVQPRVGGLALASAAGIAVGAVYGGFHYALDMVVGVALGAAAGAVALALARHADDRTAIRGSSVG